MSEAAYPAAAGEEVPNAPQEAPATQPFGIPEGVAAPAPIPEPNFQKKFESGESGPGLTPRPSKWDEFVAGGEKGLHDGAGTLWRMYQESQAPQGAQLSADAANKAYPGRAVPYSTPVNENIARMEYDDRQKQAALDEWMGRRDPTFGVRAAQWSGGMAASLTNPLNVAATLVTGGLADAALPATAPLVAKLAAHFLGTWTDFAAIDKLQNNLDQTMGAAPKSLPEIIGESAVPAAGMTAVGAGLRGLFRKFVSSGEATPENLERGIKENIASLEQNRRPPALEDQQRVLVDRRGGMTPDGPRPTLQTSPMQQTLLHAAAHSDGSPLIHEHGLGPGVQLTDSQEVANNGVSRSGSVPGQIAETGLPPESRLLDINQSAAADYTRPDSLLKQIEKATGLSLEGDTQSGESLKDVIQKLGDWAGADLGKDGKVPEDILSQIQGIAKSQGYAGYEFAGENSRQAHVFDPSTLQAGQVTQADPNATQALPAPTGGDPSQETPNPATQRMQEQGFSPEMEKIVHDFHKAHPDMVEFDPSTTAKITAEADDLKKQLTEMAKESSSAQQALEHLRDQDAQAKRLAATAQKIADCGSV